MSYNKSGVEGTRGARRRVAYVVAVAMLLVCVAAAPGRADVSMLTADNITSNRGISNGASANGVYDGATAMTTNAFSGTNDDMTVRVENFTATGTVINVTLSVRVNGTGTWNDDTISLQYSNDSGTTWISWRTGLQPPNSLTIYNNESVNASFPTLASINGAMVRLLYTRNPPSDNIRGGVDGVEMNVTYAPPPTVTLTNPENDTWRTSTTFGLNFTPTTLISLRNCSVTINGTLNATNTTALTANINNTINVSLSDGDYRWNVTCYDTSSFAGTSTVERIVHVDTTSPVVSLVAPATNNITSVPVVNVTFNVTDATTISSCILVVDGVQANSVTSPPKAQNVSLNATLTVGDHLWYVNCTDSNSWTGQSATRNISYQTTTPTISTNKSSYVQGEMAGFFGSNWQSGATVTINVTLANGSTALFNSSVNSSGNINATQNLSYTHPTGTYNVSARQTNSSAHNASTTFSVVARLVNITLSANSYIQGENVTLVGLGFHPDSTVNITVRFNASQNSTVVGANSTGGIQYSYFLPYNESLTQHNATATDRNYSALSANASFNVTARVPSVTTNKSSYVANETVGITGVLFSRVATVLFRIYNTVSGQLGLSFPVTLVANETGGFGYNWTTNHTCSGNYTVLAADQNVTQFAANTTFLISNTITTTRNQSPSSMSANRVTTTLSNATASDDTRHVLGLTSTTTNGYLQFTFTPGLPLNATYTMVNITLEHQRTSNKVNGYKLYYVNGSSLVTLTGTGCSGTPSDADTSVVCNITSHIINSTVANNLTIRVNYTRDGTGGAGDVLVDFVSVNYTWTGDPYGCVNFGDTPAAPTVSGVTVAGPIVLNAGSSKIVECNFTVTDGNGVADITDANITLFTAPSTSTSALTNVSKYQNASCLVVGSDTHSKQFSCSAQLLYYAANGTWTCNATGVSVDGTGSSAGTFVVDPLYAVNVSTVLLDFGNLQTGETSANLTENLTNIGNQHINVSVYGYGRDLGDGNSFTCDTQNISVGWLHFGSNTTANYTQKTNLTGVNQPLGFRVDVQTSPDIISTNTSFWQTKIPDDFSATGGCNGTLVFQAEPS